MFAPRNLLKSNATTFDRLLRIADPLVIVIVGWIAHLAYLDNAAMPANYWAALLGAALLSVVVFPETGLYQPKRGASLADDLRALTYGWLTVAALGISVAFLTKTSDTYSRGWDCAGSGGVVTTCGTSVLSAPASWLGKSSRACARRRGAAWS